MNPGRVKKWKERSRNVAVIQNLLVRGEGAGLSPLELQIELLVCHQIAAGHR